MSAQTCDVQGCTKRPFARVLDEDSERCRDCLEFDLRRDTKLGGEKSP